tara:strand:- start:718 stop:885 length:168 start_codon:yes stop_codon:yes gene_type:complete
MTRPYETEGSAVHLQLRATEEELARMVGDSDRAKLYKDEIVRLNAAINELERAMI